MATTYGSDTLVIAPGSSVELSATGRLKGMLNAREHIVQVSGGGQLLFEGSVNSTAPFAAMGDVVVAGTYSFICYNLSRVRLSNPGVAEVTVALSGGN